jgi:replication factor A1
LNTWTIKARVTAKTDLRHYNNKNGAGKVFSFDLLDGQGGEIRATCFNAQADQFFDLIEVDKVYLISKGSVKPVPKMFNSLNHEYEITLDHKTSIEVCVDDDSNIPRQQYNFRQISEIENIEAGAIVDLIGIVTSVGPSAIVMRKDGTQTQKRTLQLKDMSVRIIETILWGKFCDAEGHQLQLLCDSGSNPILSIKGGRVSDLSGRSVVTISSTQLKVNPDFAVAQRLKQWHITEGKNIACISLSRDHVLKTIAQIKDENLGRSDKPDFITVKGAISRLNTDNFCYPACTMEVNGRLCNRKVINNGDGTWQCDKCEKSLPNCEYRYLLRCQIQDHTGVTYATAFQEAGIEIVGHSAHELYNIREENFVPLLVL